MFYEYETTEAIWVWAHAKVYVKEVEKNIKSRKFEMGRYYIWNVYIYYFFCNWCLMSCDLLLHSVLKMN